MNMAGKLKREGRTTRTRHVAEVLAGMTDHPAIGEGGERVTEGPFQR
jgi:L-lactate dehydrogenase complex protein LldE